MSATRSACGAESCVCDGEGTNFKPELLTDSELDVSVLASRVTAAAKPPEGGAAGEPASIVAGGDSIAGSESVPPLAEGLPVPEELGPGWWRLRHFALCLGPFRRLLLLLLRLAREAQVALSTATPVFLARACRVLWLTSTGTSQPEVWRKPRSGPRLGNRAAAAPCTGAPSGDPSAALACLGGLQQAVRSWGDNTAL